MGMDSGIENVPEAKARAFENHLTTELQIPLEDLNERLIPTQRRTLY